MKVKVTMFAMAATLAVLGFLMAVGLMSLLFAPQVDSFAPKSSADAAAWVQAIGSVFAIYCSFRLGAWQAQEAQRQAVVTEARQRTRIEDGYRAVIEQLHRSGSDLFDVIQFQDHRQMRLHWTANLGPMTAASLAAFRTIPAHDLGNNARIRAAFKLYTAVQTMYGHAEAAYGDKNKLEVVDHHAVLVEGTLQRRLFEYAWNELEAAY